MAIKGFRKDAPLMVEAAAEDASLVGPAAPLPSRPIVAPQAGAA